MEIIKILLKILEYYVLGKKVLTSLRVIAVAIVIGIVLGFVAKSLILKKSDKKTHRFLGISF
jgi:Na+-translocating ferredoxin:NAD+ oxidoreductase RnfA subunit